MNTSLIEHIIDGSIHINTLDAYNSMLREFPCNPDLLKLHADFLADRNRNDLAAEDFAGAAGMFLGCGRLLKALVSKMLQWKLKRPQRGELIEFHQSLESTAHDGRPASIFLQALNTGERLALFSYFERVWVPAATTIKKVGDRENVLAFVVSGELKETRYQLLDKKREAARGFTRKLEEGDVFGDVYPLNGAPASPSYVDTLKRTELVLISRSKLRRVCRKFPNVEGGLLELIRTRSDSTEHPTADKIRRGGRYRIAVPMTLEILPSASNEAAVSLPGYSLDLSVSGMLFIPQLSDNQDAALLSGLSERAVSRSVRVTIPSKDFRVAIAGRVVRSRSVTVNGSKKPAFGIRFAEVPLRLRGVFFALAESASLKGPGFTPPLASREADGAAA
jgi:CRP-like cAMP-binding protein